MIPPPGHKEADLPEAQRPAAGPHRDHRTDRAARHREPQLEVCVPRIPSVAVSSRVAVPVPGRDDHRSCAFGHVRARASYGPATCAQAANLVSGHYVPVYRATLLLCQLAGIQVSSGWMAGVRGKAAALVEACGFMEHIRALLKTAPAVHADETPARAVRDVRGRFLTGWVRSSRKSNTCATSWLARGG